VKKGKKQLGLPVEQTENVTVLAVNCADGTALDPLPSKAKICRARGMVIKLFLKHFLLSVTMGG